MKSREFLFPKRFVLGTVGMPGERTFFLQILSDTDLMSFSLEKQQAALLASEITNLLDDVGYETGSDQKKNDQNPDLEPLSQPIEDEFRIGGLSISWLPDLDAVRIEISPSLESDLDIEVETLINSVIKVVITAISARHFVSRTLAVVRAGRPPCPFCFIPIDPTGHICVRSNGYRR
jgi:uncharacterized repeat protein (TIGR03847 family)